MLETINTWAAAHHDMMMVLVWPATGLVVSGFFQVLTTLGVNHPAVKFVGDLFAKVGLDAGGVMKVLQSVVKTEPKDAK